MPELGKATYFLELNTAEFDAGLTNAEARATAATNGIAKGFGMVETSAAGAAAGVGVAAKDVSVSADQMALSFEEAGAAATTMGSEVEAGAGEAAAASETAAAKTGFAWTTAATRLEGIGKRMRSLGRDMTHKITLPVAVVAGIGVKEFLDYSQNLKLLQTQAGATAKEVANVKKGISTFVDEGSIHAPVALAEAMFHIESVGFRGAKALEVLKTASQGAMVGTADLESTTYALVSAQETAIKGTETLGSTMGNINAIIGSGDMRLEDLTGALSTGIAPAAKSAGLSLKDIGAALDVMTARGMPAQISATRLAMSIAQMQAPTGKAAKALKSIGITADDLAAQMRSRGLPAALRFLSDHLDKATKGMDANAAANMKARLTLEAFGGGRSGKAMLLLLQNLDDLDERYRSIAKHAQDYNAAVEAAKQEPINRLKAAWAKLQMTLINIGAIVVPVLVQIGDKIAGIAQAFDRLSPGTKKFIVVAALLAAAIGPLLSMLGLMAIGITGLATAFGALDLTAAPWIALGAAIAIVAGAMIMAVEAPEQLQAMLEKLGMSADAAAKTVTALATAFHVVADVVKTEVTLMLMPVKLVFQQIGNEIDIIVGLLTGDWSRAWRGMKGLIMDPLNFVKNWVKTWVKGMLSVFSDLWTGVKRGALNLALDILKALDFTVFGRHIIPGVHALVQDIERELAAMDSKDAAKRAADGYHSVFVPGMTKAGVAGRKGVETEIGKIGVGAAAARATSGFVSTMGAAGTKAGDEAGKNLVAAMDPWFLLLAQSGGNAIDQIQTGLMGLASGFDALAKKYAAIAYVTWDGKVWRDAQGKVLKDQQKAWDAWNVKMHQSAIMRKPPKAGTTIQLNPKAFDQLTTAPKTTTTTTTPPPGTDGTGTKGSYQLPFRFRQRETIAARYGDKATLKVLHDEETYLRNLLKHFKGSREKRLEIEQKLTDVITQINSINASTAKTISKTDLAADLIPKAMLRAESKAIHSRGYKDDVAIFTKIHNYLLNLLKHFHGSVEKRKVIQAALNQINDKLRDANKGITDALTKIASNLVLETPQQRIRASKAERTKSLKDDIAAEKAHLAYLKDMLSHLPKTKKYLEARAQLVEAITESILKIRDLTKQQADAQESLNDANRAMMRAYLNERASFFSSFGPSVFTQSAPSVGSAQPTRTPGTGVAHFATGGIVGRLSGYEHGRGQGGKDTVPAMLTPGEMVLNKDQQERVFGRGVGSRVSTMQVTTPLVKLYAGRVETGKAAPPQHGSIARILHDHPLNTQATLPTTARAMLLGSPIGSREAVTRAERDPSVTTVNVNQNFPHMPTVDKYREAIYAATAFRHAFDAE